MSTALVSPVPRQMAFGLGVFSPGAKLSYYDAGSSTRATTWSNIDRASIHENTSPIVADSTGLFGPIYLAPGVLYDVVLLDANDVPIWSQPNIGIGGDPDAPYFNVIDYGATGNGSTDDAAAVQAAIDAASVSGGIVFFPAGTYRLIASLTCTASHVRFLGVGRSESILQWTDAATKGLVITGPTAGVATTLNANAVIGDRDLTLLSGAGLAAGRWAYMASSGSETAAFLTRLAGIVGVTATLEEAMPIPLATADTATFTSYDALIEGLSIRDLALTCVAGSGTANKLTLLEMNRCNAPDVANVDFNGAVAPLVTPKICKNGTLRNCTFRNAFTSAGSATEIQTSTGFSVQNCSATNVRFGFVAARSPRTRIVDCSAAAIPDVSGGRGVKLSASSHFSIVESTTQNDAGFSGVRIESCSYVSVVGLTAFANSPGQNGAGCIELSGTVALCVHNTINGCTILGGLAQAAGIVLSFGSDLATYHLVVGNNISGCVRQAIFCNSSHNTFIGNIIGSADASEAFLITTGGQNLIDDNQFIAESGSVAPALDTTTSSGTNVIGINKSAKTFSLHATDVVAATTSVKVTATQSAMHTGANTTETTAWTVTIPGNTFAATLAQGFSVDAFLDTANNANDKTIKVKIGTLVFTYALVGAAATLLQIHVRVSAFFVAGSMAVTLEILSMTSVAAIGQILIQAGTSSDDWSNNVDFKITMTNGTASANDINFGSGKFVYESVRPTPAI